MPNLAEKISAIRARRDRLRSLLESLERTGESQVSLTDPDSRAMAAHTRVAEGFFAKDAFRYDAAEDVYVCPAGERLSPKYESKSRELTKIDYSNRSACLACALRPRCTKTFRRVSRLENEAVLDRMAARLKARPEVLDRRRESVEHPFGSIKQWMGQGAFLTKGLENVRAEFSLTALAYNLGRAINVLGASAMLAAVGDRESA